MIKMTGKILIFDKPTKNGDMISKDCKITLPETVPVTWEFQRTCPGDVIGTAIVAKQPDCVTCDIKLHKFDREFLRDQNDEIGIGGYYDQVSFHMENEIKVVDKARLRMVGVTLMPVDDELKAIVVEKEK